MSNRLPDEISQDEEPTQGGLMAGRTGLDRATSNYLSSPEGESSLIGSLGGGAAAPAGGSGGMGALMLPLLMAQMQQQQRQATSPLSAFANAYAGATGRPAPAQQNGLNDPLKVMTFVSHLVNQQDIMQSRQDARQIGQAKLILADQANQRAEQTQRRADERLDRDSLKPIIDDLIKNGGEAGKRYGWQQRSRDLAKVTGQGLPDDVIEDMATGVMDTTKMKDMVGYIQDGVDPDTVAAVYKVPPQQLQKIVAMAQSPAFLHAMDIKAGDEDWKQQERAIKVKQAQLADVREERQQQHEQRMEKNMLLTNERMARNEDRADQRLANWQTAFAQKMDTKDEKKKTMLATMRDMVDQMEQEGLALDAKGMLPKSAGWFATQQAKMNRALSPSDTNLTNFQKVLQGGGVGFDRSVLGDLGPRALAGYKGMINFYDNPPTLPGLQNAAARMRRLIDVAESGQAPQRERIVYQLLDPATKQPKTFQADWQPGFNLPPGAKMLMIGADKVDY